MTCVKDTVYVYSCVYSPVNSTVYDLLLDLHAVESSIDFRETGDSTDGLPEQAVGDGEHVRLVDNGDLLRGRINVCNVSQHSGNARLAGATKRNVEGHLADSPRSTLGDETGCAGFTSVFSIVHLLLLDVLRDVNLSRELQLYQSK